MCTGIAFKLLLIEPCDDCRSLMTVLLELAGCEVRSASNGVTGVTIAKTFQPDMILTELAGVGGFEIAQQLKLVQEAKHIHIVALTSFYWSGIETEAATAGFSQYLLKPTAFDSLIQVLASLAMRSGKKLSTVHFADHSASF